MGGRVGTGGLTGRIEASGGRGSSVGDNPPGCASAEPGGVNIRTEVVAVDTMAASKPHIPP